jgi:hypothetical protein
LTATRHARTRTAHRRGSNLGAHGTWIGRHAARVGDRHTARAIGVGADVGRTRQAGGCLAPARGAPATVVRARIIRTTRVVRGVRDGVPGGRAGSVTRRSDAIVIFKAGGGSRNACPGRAKPGVHGCGRAKTGQPEPGGAGNLHAAGRGARPGVRDRRAESEVRTGAWARSSARRVDRGAPHRDRDCRATAKGSARGVREVVRHRRADGSRDRAAAAFAGRGRRVRGAMKVTAESPWRSAVGSHARARRGRTCARSPTAVDGVRLELVEFERPGPPDRNRRRARSWALATRSIGGRAGVGSRWPGLAFARVGLRRHRRGCVQERAGAVIASDAGFERVRSRSAGISRRIDGRCEPFVTCIAQVDGVLETPDGRTCGHACRQHRHQEGAAQDAGSHHRQDSSRPPRSIVAAQPP